MAFWSGTDNADEYETRFYGVFGQLNKEEHAELFRIFVNKEEISLSKDVFFEKRKETIDEINVQKELTEIESQIQKYELRKTELEKEKQSLKKDPIILTNPEWLNKINKLEVVQKTPSMLNTQIGLQRFPSLANIKKNNPPSTSFKREWFEDDQQNFDFSLFDEKEIEWETEEEELMEDCIDGIIDQTDAFMNAQKTEEFFQQLEEKGVLSYFVRKVKERGLC